MPTPSRSRLLPLLPVLLLILAGAAAIAGEQDEPITRPGCPDKCGNMSIPFPFGLMRGCFREGFQVTCDHSFDPPRAFLTGGYKSPNYITLTERDESAVADDAYSDVGLSYVNSSIWAVELTDVSVERSEARAYGPSTSRCSTNSRHSKLKEQAMTLQGAFAISQTLNVVVGVGWRADVTVRDGTSSHSWWKMLASCRSELAGGHLEHARNGSCAGRGCCEAALSSEPEPEAYEGTLPGVSAENNTLWRTSPCSYAMVIEKSRYTFSTSDLYGDEVLPRRFPRGVPVVLDFAVVGGGGCPGKGQRPPPDYACVSNNSLCVNATVGQSSHALSYVCKCSEHYQGNPYIANGCRDIDECEFPELYYCSSKGICMNRFDGYDCPCKPGMEGDGKLGHCAEKLPRMANTTVGAATIAGEQDEKQLITRPGCPDKCGNMSIPFPFGLLPGCFREGFQSTCDHSFDPPRAVLAGGHMGRNIITLTERDESVVSDNVYLGYKYFNTSSWAVELTGVSIDRSEAWAYGPITSRCSTNIPNSKLKEQDMMLEGPFAISKTLNVVIGVGWRVGVTHGSSSNPDKTFACRSELAGGHLKHARNGSCAGRGCCKAALSSEPMFTTLPGVSAENNTLWRTSPCSYAMVIEKSRYSFSMPDLYGDKLLPRRFHRGVPVVLDFAIVGNAACPGKGQQLPPDYACVSNNSYCVNATVHSRHALSYVCKCSEHYQGNPYIANGCRDIDECKFPELYYCSSKGICMNRLNGYDCPCKPGMKGDGKLGQCAENSP